MPDDILELSVDTDTEQHFKVANRKRNLGYNALIWVLVLAFIIVSIFVGTLIFTLISSDMSKAEFTNVIADIIPIFE